MRKLYLPVIIFLSSCLSSCVDIEEHYDFKQDGSCKVVYDFDMSKAVAVLMNLMSDSLKQTPEFGIIKDTTLNFYSALPDSTQQKLSADEVKMTKGSDLNIKMNLKRGMMKVSINHQAESYAGLEYYLQHLSDISAKSRLKGITGSSKQPVSFDAQKLLVGEDYYNYQVTPHRFYRVIDMNKFKIFLKKSQSTFVMAKAMLIDMPYKIVLNFATPVKKINNPKAVLSAGRKRVSLVTNMEDVLKNPSVMNLKIDF